MTKHIKSKNQHKTTVTKITGKKTGGQKKPTLKQVRGHVAESVVADIIRKKGYHIYERNYKVHRIGEIDLIAGRDDRVIFIEVKARHNAERWGGPEAAISHAKIEKIRKTAACYLKHKHKMNNTVYFLAALVKTDQNGKPVDIDFRPIDFID